MMLLHAKDFGTMSSSRQCLFMCLFVVLIPDYFTHTKTSPLPGTGRKVMVYAKRLLTLSRERSLSRHTSIGKGPMFLCFHPKDLLRQARVLRTFSSTDSHRSRKFQVTSTLFVLTILGWVCVWLKFTQSSNNEFCIACKRSTNTNC